MKFWDKREDFEDDAMDDVEAEALQEALTHFKQSVDAWSEAAYSRERTAQVVRRRSWRPAAGWALGCVLVAGSLSGAVYEHHQRQELTHEASVAGADAARAAEREKASQEQPDSKPAANQKSGQDEEDLLAKVDSDVSQAVPSAMEPLAQLMADDSSK